MKFRCKCFSKDFCVIYSLVYFCWFVNLLLIQKEKKLKKKKKKKSVRKHNEPSKFRTKDWVKINDESRGMYDVNSNIIDLKQ